MNELVELVHTLCKENSESLRLLRSLTNVSMIQNSTISAQHDNIKLLEERIARLERKVK